MHRMQHYISAFHVAKRNNVRLFSALQHRIPIIHIHDTRTGQKKELTFEKEQSNLVTMYVCGPTVYDSSHLGHARTYVQFDIVRRLLTTMLGYEVLYTMNITDIDDKIVDRAAEMGESCSSLSTRFTKEFFEDMDRLGILRPSICPTVTEYMNEIIDFIERLVDGNFAYESNGSVYFNTKNFENHGLEYGQLHSAGPRGAKEEQLQDLRIEQEASQYVNEKRNPQDFALWKAHHLVDESKLNDSIWMSPWGVGRPGWHVECSAMIEATLGKINNNKRLDIHGGGIDLRFPHHENERAQSEASLCCGPNKQTAENIHEQPWSNIFMHTGHLHIHGLKMSKSLKNFITIRQVLDPELSKSNPYALTPRQLRLMFLFVKYSAPLELSETMVENAKYIDLQFANFFSTVSHVTDHANKTVNTFKFNQEDLELIQYVSSQRAQILKHICNDFDTPTVMKNLQQVMHKTNQYMTNNPEFKPSVVRKSAMLVQNFLSNVGIGSVQGIENNVPGYTESLTSDLDSSSLNLSESPVHKLVDTIVDFRSTVRKSAKEQDYKNILKQCDQLRDISLPTLGVVVQDRVTGTSSWKKMDASEAKQLEKLRNKPKSVPKVREQVDPRSMYLSQTDLYSQFDEFGVPTHNAEGEPLTKTAFKKLRKKQEKLFKRQESKKN